MLAPLLFFLEDKLPSLRLFNRLWPLLANRFRRSNNHFSNGYYNLLAVIPIHIYPQIICHLLYIIYFSDGGRTVIDGIHHRESAGRIVGFRLGARMMLDITNDYRGPFKSIEED